MAQHRPALEGTLRVTTRITSRVLGAGLVFAAGVSSVLAQGSGLPVGPRGRAPNQERPDVVVSTVGNEFTKYGTVGSITGYAVTTVSCNVGTHEAIWISDGNPLNPLRAQHPVIGSSAYRLKGGRFEQIGISWLKHGFCAADAPNCGSPYTPNDSCNWLGRFATDTYGADLNADQANLGPRSEVNAWTGQYPYPYILAWQQTGNAIYKRLQIRNSDLDPALNPGALYFCEVVYIPSDEWPEQRFNNGSWRRFNVGSLQAGGYNLGLTGATTWQQYAIGAWAANDKGVTLVNVDAGHDGTATGGDGRFIVGSKVTDNGDGTWEYEYAVYNANNHRAARALTVPMNCGVAVTNIGFKDVDYHSGEPYSGTDWATTSTGGGLRWATESFGENSNANALRWSTLYNFRFTANTGPTDKTASLDLFLPGPAGAPDVLTFTVAGPADPACRANWNHDGVTNSTDVSDFINDWFVDQDAGTSVTDVNCDGLSNSTDVSDFINMWFEAIDSGCF
jgi:hypothetical protein